jgi:hypothetical protein
MKINYVKSTRDGKTISVLTADFVASRVANKSIDGVTLPGNDESISLGLSGGAVLRIRAKNAGTEIAYVPPNGE